MVSKKETKDVKPALDRQKVTKSVLKTRYLKLRSKKNRVKQEVSKLIKYIKVGFKDMIFYGFVYGLIINYTLFSIFHVSFHWWGFPAYGILLYLIKSEFIEIWKDIWFRSE